MCPLHACIYPPPTVCAPGGAILQRLGVAGMIAWRLTKRTWRWPAGRVGWGKMYLWAAVSEEGKGRGPCWGEVPELDPGGWGGKGGLAQNVDSASRGTFRPEIPHTLPPSTLPVLPTLAPWEAWNPGSFSGQKDPVTSHLLPWQRTVRSWAALPIRRGREPQIGPWGLGRPQPQDPERVIPGSLVPKIEP